MSIIRIRVPEIARNTPVGRGLWQFSCAAAFGLASLKALVPTSRSCTRRPSRSLCSSGASKTEGVPFVMNVQDLFPQSAVDLGILRNRGLIRVFEALERHLYRRGGRRHGPLGGEPGAMSWQRGAREGTTRVMENTVGYGRDPPGPAHERSAQGAGCG